MAVLKVKGCSALKWVSETAQPVKQTVIHMSSSLQDTFPASFSTQLIKFFNGSAARLVISSWYCVKTQELHILLRGGPKLAR